MPDPERVLMGIELKGWFILAKEGEPSFRYRASPMVCAPQDFLVVYPWALDEVVSGSPKLMRPFVEEARYAADHRNYYWQELRGVTGAAAGVTLAEHQTPYPLKSQKFNDEAASDQGGNFGRVARGGLMTAFIEELMAFPLSGIPARHWQQFLKIFAGDVQTIAVNRGLTRIRGEAIAAGLPADKLAAVDQLIMAIRELYDLGPGETAT